MLAATAPNRNNHSPRAAEQYARSALALVPYGHYVRDTLPLIGWI